MDSEATSDEHLGSTDVALQNLLATPASHLPLLNAGARPCRLLHLDPGCFQEEPSESTLADAGGWKRGRRRRSGEPWEGFLKTGRTCTHYAESQIPRFRDICLVGVRSASQARQRQRTPKKRARRQARTASMPFRQCQPGCSRKGARVAERENCTPNAGEVEPDVLADLGSELQNQKFSPPGCAGRSRHQCSANCADH